MIVGNPTLKVGVYELRQTFFDWKSLLFALALAACGWATSTFIPSLQEEGGLLAALGAVLAIAVRFVIEWIRDNSGRKIPHE